MGLSPLVLHMNYAIIDVESTVTQSPYFASYQRLPADSMHAVQESGGRSYSSPISKRAHVRRAGVCSPAAHYPELSITTDMRAAPKTQTLGSFFTR